MKRIFATNRRARKVYILYFAFIMLLSGACRDDYYEVNKPSWLGESIYEQLQQGYKDSTGVVYTFKNFVKLIDELEYTEVLRKTGSKTLFVADDKAFERFFASNPWRVTSYEQLTTAQKKLILNSAMINNAYLVELMSNTVGPVEGQALRRSTAVSVLDSITYERPDYLPENANWDRFREKGIYIVKDNTTPPMVHFLPKQMRFKNVTDDDFSVIFNGKTRAKNDAYIFDRKIIVRDITCKNGYINILDGVLVPPSNMAEIIRTAPETGIFSRILERYAAPYYDDNLTKAYKLLHPEFTDSIFVKKYFAERSSNGANLSNPRGELQAGYLEFDPGWNTYTMSNTAGMQTDMGVIFAPSDEIMNKFFYEGGGKFLTEKFGRIENIPNDRLDDLLRNLMKTSFLGALPGKFPEILDDGKEPMGISKGDVVRSYIANNGVVYVTNKIYAPASYVAVTAPTLVNDQMKIVSWAVKKLQFDAYLLSMDSYYSFIVPWDVSEPLNEKMGAGMYYIDPVSLGKAQPEIFRFWYHTKTNTVKATAYKYDPNTGVIGDSIRLVSDLEINDRMDDFLDYHIVVGDIEDGKEYYRTKGGGQLKIKGTGKGMKIMGGGNIENEQQPKVTRIYDQTKQTNGRGNGKTYVVDQVLQPSVKSVYKILDEDSKSENPKFNEFFKLLQGNDEATEAELKKYQIFYTDPSYAGLDLNVKFFNTYHYTVYIPTNEAVRAAIDAGLPTWDIIKQETDQVLKDSLTSLLVNFLRYHFQDNSLFVNGSTSSLVAYETAAYSTTGKKTYYKLYTKLAPGKLTLYSDPNDPSTAVHVVTSDPTKYNIMAREYKFNNKDREKATQIETSSFASIHQIDKVLLYDKNQLKKMRSLVNRSAAVKKANVKRLSK